MAKMRSPRYPAISLRDAIEKARAVYNNDHRNRIRKELVAEHMGYHSLNGASLAVISAVSKYGLLEGGAEAMNITPRAVDIFEHELGEPARMQAIRDAAVAPELFKEVSSTFPGRVSDAAIRSHLITKLGFLPEAATNFVRAYRETMALVELETDGYDSAPSEQESAPMEPITTEGKVAQLQAMPAQLGSTRLAAPPSLGNGERELVTGILSKGASFRLVVSGKVGEKEIERLIKKLELDKEILADPEDEVDPDVYE